MRTLDRLLDGAADRVLDWSARHAAPDHPAEWVAALRGELALVQGGADRLLWALGGISIVCSTRRTTLTRTWRSLPAPLRVSAFGLALAVAMVIAIVWSNVIVPDHESDDEYTGWYLVFYLALFAYFGLSGYLAARGGSSIRVAMLTGAVTALLSVGIALVTFTVIDNLFLSIVMTQPDKAAGFARSGMISQRDYVNQGVSAIFAVLPVVSGIGALLGLVGGSLGIRRDPPPATATQT